MEIKYKNYTIIYDEDLNIWRIPAEDLVFKSLKDAKLSIDGGYRDYNQVCFIKNKTVYHGYITTKTGNDIEVIADGIKYDINIFNVYKYNESAIELLHSLIDVEETKNNIFESLIEYRIF